MRRKFRLLSPLSVGLYSSLLISLCLSSCGSKIEGSNAVGNSSTDSQIKNAGSKVFWEALPQITSFAFSDANTAWLITEKDGALLQTGDGGLNWIKASANISDSSHGTKLSQLSFLDSERGWAVNGQGQVLRSVDGGRTWNRIGQLESRDPKWKFSSAVQLDFTDELNGWIIETFTIWHTEDGGVNWSQVFSVSDPRVQGQPVRGFFLNALIAWICGTDGEIYHTTDGGKSWKIQTIESLAFSDIFFINEKTGWLSRQTDGQVFRTADGGKHWQPQPRAKINTYIKSIWFFNENEGWAIGRHLADAHPENIEKDRDYRQGIVLRTFDGGKSWQDVLVSKDDPFFDKIYFTDEKHGWLFGRDNVYRTSDAGNTWQIVLRLPPISEKSE